MHRRRNAHEMLMHAREWQRQQTIQMQNGSRITLAPDRDSTPLRGSTRDDDPIAREWERWQGEANDC